MPQHPPPRNDAEARFYASLHTPLGEQWIEIDWDRRLLLDGTFTRDELALVLDAYNRYIALPTEAL